MSKNVERALMFLDWVQSNQKNYDLFMYGRKGQDYTLEDHDYILPQGCDSEFESGYLGWQSRDAFMNMQYERFKKGTTEGLNETYTDFIDKNTVSPPHSGFYPDYSKLSFEGSDRFYMIQQINLNIYNGILPKANIDSASLQSSNDSTLSIIKDIQAQLTAWKRKK